MIEATAQNIAELMKIFKSPAIPDNSKFPRVCSGIRNLKEGKGRYEMCALVEAYAEQKAREAEKRLADRMLKDGKLTMDDISIYFPTLSEDDINELESGEIWSPYKPYAAKQDMGTDQFPLSCF